MCLVSDPPRLHSPACDEAHEPAAAGLSWRGLLQGEDVEPEQLDQTLQTDAGVQLHPRAADQQYPHQTLHQLPRTGTVTPLYT